MTTTPATSSTAAWPAALPLDATGKDRVALFTARGIPAIIAEILVRRGYDTPEYAAIALGGTLEDHRVSPDALPDLRRAIALTVQAIAEGRRIVVRGDFDADGVCSTATLVRGLTRAGAAVSWQVPHRTRDGRDFTAAQATAMAPVGGILLCVDHGTNAPEALAAAMARGADVIVLDHHRPQALPQAGVLCVNPHRPDCTYAQPDVCATLLAWHFLRALAEAQGLEASTVDWAAELAAIATLADNMPLVGENRALVRAVLPLLPRTRLPGLRALLRVARLGDRPTLTARDIIFDLVPHLNAPGRVSDAGDAVRLLLSDDPIAVARMSDSLGVLNDHRRCLEERVLTAVWRQVASAPSTEAAVVLRGHDWHPGVISIVASRVAERCGKPALVLVADGDVWRGSCRSGRTGADVFRAVQTGAAHVTAWGGHKEAVGVTIPDAELVAFEAIFQATLAAAASVPVPRGDARVPDVADVLTSLPAGIDEWLRHMGPFGQGFRPPRVVVRGACITLDRVGVHRTHLDGALTLADGSVLAIWGPRLADTYPPELLRGVPVEIVGALDLHRGRVRLLAEVIQRCEPAPAWAA